MFEVFFEVLLVLRSEVRHSAVEVPRVLLFVLEALHVFCTCLPTLQTSSQFTWPHVHEFFALLGSISASDLHVVVQSFVLSTMLLVSTFRVADRDRPLRNPFVRAKVPLFVSGGALAVAWPSFAEGRSYVAHGSGIIVAWGCEPPAPMLGASMCPASSSSPGG